MLNNNLDEISKLKKKTNWWKIIFITCTLMYGIILLYSTNMIDPVHKGDIRTNKQDTVYIIDHNSDYVKYRLDSVEVITKILEFKLKYKNVSK